MLVDFLKYNLKDLLYFLIEEVTQVEPKYMDVQNDFKLKQFFSLNAYTSMTVLKRVDLGVYLNNITNRLNISNGSVADNIPYYLIDNPFSFFVDVKIRF